MLRHENLQSFNKKCPGASKLLRISHAEPTVGNITYNISYVKKKEFKASERLFVRAGMKGSCFSLLAAACKKQFHDFIRVGFAAAEQLKLTGSLDSALL